MWAKGSAVVRSSFLFFFSRVILQGGERGRSRDSAASLTASSPYPISFGACCFVPGKPESSLFVV